MDMTINEMSNMYPEHRFVMENFQHLISNFIKGKNCVIMREAKYQWMEYPEEKFEPDISILCGLRHRKKLCYTDVPRFIAEVLSDGTEKYDRVEKMKIYAEVGVQEYWLVDWRIAGGLVERYMLDDAGERYLLHDRIQGDSKEDTTINIISFPNITFSMQDLFEHIGEDILM